MFLSRFSAIQIWQSYQLRGHVMSNVLHAERGLGWDWLSWPIALLLWGLVCGTFHGLDKQDLPIHAQWIKCGSQKKHVGQVHGTLEAVRFFRLTPYSFACAMLRSKEDIRVLWDKLDRGCEKGNPKWNSADSRDCHISSILKSSFFLIFRVMSAVGHVRILHPSVKLPPRAWCWACAPACRPIRTPHHPTGPTSHRQSPDIARYQVQLESWPDLDQAELERLVSWLQICPKGVGEIEWGAYFFTNACHSITYKVTSFSPKSGFTSRIRAIKP